VGTPILVPSIPPRAPLPFMEAALDGFGDVALYPDPQQPDPFNWTPEQEAEYDARPPHGIELVPDRPRCLTLRDYVTRVDFIAQTVESLDDDELDEETRDELSRALITELAGTREKVDSVASTLAMFEHMVDSAEKERERLAKRSAYYRRQTERLEHYVLMVLETSKLDRIDGDTSSLRRHLNPWKVIVDNPAAIPPEFLRTPQPAPPPPPLPDKAAIARAIKAKQPVPGARLERGAKLVRS
jgi:hypothetical protein